MQRMKIEKKGFKIYHKKTLLFLYDFFLIKRIYVYSYKEFGNMFFIGIHTKTQTIGEEKKKKRRRKRRKVLKTLKHKQTQKLD